MYFRIKKLLLILFCVSLWTGAAFSAHAQNYSNQQDNGYSVEKTKQLLFKLSWQQYPSLDKYLLRNPFSEVNTSLRLTEDQAVQSDFTLEHQMKRPIHAIKHQPTTENFLSSTYLVMEQEVSPYLKAQTLAGLTHNSLNQSSTMLGSNLSYSVDDKSALQLQAHHGLRRFDDNKASTTFLGGVKILLN